MKKSGVFVDDSQLLEMYKELDEKERKKVYKSALNSSLRIVKRQALMNLKQNVKLTTKKIKIKKIKASKPKYQKIYKNKFVTIKWKRNRAKTKKPKGRIQDGINIKVFKSAKSGNINIMGDFRLKWFQMGTKERKWKNGKSTGQIKETKFFTKAISQKEDEVFGNIRNELQKFILKINRKKFR